MADQATETLNMGADQERCLAVVTDFDSYPEWASDIKEVTVKERDSDGRASLVNFRAAAFGRSTSYTLRYDYSELPSVISWVQADGDLTSKLDGRYEFSAAEDGFTAVTYHLSVELKVPIPGFVKKRAESRIVGSALRDLKARVES